MENLAIRVNSESESKEVQALLCELGAVGGISEIKSKWVCSWDGFITLYDFLPCVAFKDITIPQLRDLVVLKRNDKNDRNVIDPEYADANLYLDSNNDLFVFYIPKQEWRVSHLNGEEEVIQRLKPIEKPMKEYLDPDNGYALITADDEIKGCSNWIEVPEGFNFAIKNRYGIYFFESGGFHHRDLIWQRHVEKEYINRTTGEYRKTADVVTGEQWIEVSQKHNFAFKADNGDIRFSDGFSAYLSESLLWKRSSTPFHHNAATPNNQNAEIEQVRQELKGIDATLAERQATYGDFKSVANTTGQLMAVILNSKNGKTLPYAHEEALHMICSKIARIVNGDYNHKDSWHDIGGYAKLVEDLL